MKLVAAKCPNCGSNLNVNPNDEAVKCKYCKSAILIDDAINKYKLEISGEIEINNLPKANNYLKLAERSYSNKNFDEAYKNYEKIIELQPDNKVALLRYSICKTLLNNYVDFSLDYLFNSVEQIFEDNSFSDVDIEKYIVEIIYAIDESLYATRKYYNSYALNQSELVEVQNKLISILNCYELIIKYTQDKNNYIIKQIISVLSDLIKDKNYKSGTSREGGNFFKTYKTNYHDKSVFQGKLVYYKKLLNTDSNFDSTDEIVPESNDQIKQRELNKSVIVIIDIFLILSALGSIMNKHFVSCIILILIFSVLTFNKITLIIFKNDINKKKHLLITLVVLLFIAMAWSI